jgi:hypothetical protein
MVAISIPAHCDGNQILLDQHFELKPNAKLFLSSSNHKPQLVMTGAKVNGHVPRASEHTVHLIGSRKLVMYRGET